MPNFTIFYILFNANKWDISNRTQNNCLSKANNYLFYKHIVNKSVEEELILF